MSRILQDWWQKYLLGRLRTPQQIVAASRVEPNASDTRFFGVPEDNAFRFDVPERLRRSMHFRSDGWLRQSERADWQGCDPRLAYWAALFVEYGRRRGIPLYVHCAFRNREEQERVNHLGRSKAKWGQSPHNRGAAVDVVHGVYHWDMTRAEWQYLALLGRFALARVNTLLVKDRQIGLEWGGSWAFYDPAHWQLDDWRKRDVVQEGEPKRVTPRAILAAKL